MTDRLFPDGAVLVVGGSGGIGRYVCQEFAKAGTDVALTYRGNQKVAEETADAIRKLGRKASIHKVDTTADGDVEAAVEAAAKEHGRIHTVIYGAAPLTEQLFISEYTWSAGKPPSTRKFTASSRSSTRRCPSSRP